MIEPKIEVKPEPSEVNFEEHNPDIDCDATNNLPNIKLENDEDVGADFDNGGAANCLEEVEEEEHEDEEQGDNEEEEEEEEEDDDNINIIINTSKSTGNQPKSTTTYKLTSLQKQASTETTAVNKSSLAPAITIPDESSTTTPAVDYSMTVMADEDKPWKKPGADITDFFNYGFTEDSWVTYCEKQKDLRQKYGTSLSRAVVPNPLAQNNKLKTTKSSMHVVGAINVIGDKVPQVISTVGNAIPTLGQPNQVKTIPTTPDMFNQPPPGFLPPPFSMPPPGTFLPGFTPGMPPPFPVMPPSMMMPPGMMPPPVMPPDSGMPNIIPNNNPVSTTDNQFQPSDEYSSYAKSDQERPTSPNTVKRLNDWDRDSHDGHSSEGSDSGYHRKRSKHEDSSSNHRRESSSSHRRDSRKSKRRSDSRSRHTSKRRKRSRSRSTDRY